jgi:hypothetical protein
MKIKCLIFTFFITTSVSTFGKDLSEVALFTRCHMHLTQTFPKNNLPLMVEVKSGSKTAIVACEEILDSVAFSANGNTTLTNPADQTAVNVVKVFHNLHYSWFATKYYPPIVDYYIQNSANIFDVSSPALYITKELFDPVSNFDDIFAGDITLRSLREQDERTTTVLVPHSPADDILQGIKFSGIGNLIGISSMIKNDSYGVLSYDKDPNPPTVPAATLVVRPPIVINTHWGGGVIGSQIYLIQNIQGTSISHKTDGGVNSNRKWSRSVFHDFFCRELPVVRESDVGGFVLPQSSLTYRNTKGCVKCHASIDPMSGIVRNAKYDKRGVFFDKGSYAFMTKHAVSKEMNSYFPSEPDADFHLRPTDGSFFYRTYNGELIHKEMSDLNTLSTEMLKLDDIYICTAKRYFEYFTGISANITDIADPANANYPSLSAHQKKYRDIVISMGKSLKQHKNMKRMIKDILESPAYKNQDFGISE